MEKMTFSLLPPESSFVKLLLHFIHTTDMITLYHLTFYIVLYFIIKPYYLEYICQCPSLGKVSLFKYHPGTSGAQIISSRLYSSNFIIY